MINRDDNLPPEKGESLKEKLDRRKLDVELRQENKEDSKFRKNTTEQLEKISETLSKNDSSQKEKLDKRKSDDKKEKDKKTDDEFKKNINKKIDKFESNVAKLTNAISKDKEKDTKEINRISEEISILTKRKENTKKKVNAVNVLTGDVGLSDLIKKQIQGAILKTKGRDALKQNIIKTKRKENIKKTIAEKGYIKGIATLIRDNKLDKKYKEQQSKLNRDLLKNKVEENKKQNNLNKLDKSSKNLSDLKDDVNSISLNQEKMNDAVDKLTGKIDDFISDNRPKSEPVKQETDISRATYDDKEHKWNTKSQKIPVKPVKNNQNGNSNGSPDIDIDLDDDRKKSKRQRRIDRLKKANRMSKLSSVGRSLVSPKMLGAGAVVASGMYIGDSLLDNYEQYQMSDNEAGRNDAVAKSVGGVAGAVTGGIVGAKALGTAGLIGGSVVPGLGNLAGLVGGSVTGGAAGAALGYYMGEGVGDYIENMWTGPLEKIPDSKRNNPFTIHEYLNGALIPELYKSLEMEQDPKKREDIEKGIGEYEDLAKKILDPESLKKWMQIKLDDNKLATADVSTKVTYLNELMGQFSYNENYFNAGKDVIDSVSKNTGTIDKYVGRFDEFIFGKKSKDESDKKNLESANELTKFNEANTLGKDGKSIELSLNSSKNFETLVGSGLVSDDWGSNSIKDVSKLNQLPLSVLKDLKENGSLDDSSTKALNKLINDKSKAQSKKEEINPEKVAPITTSTTKLTSTTDGESDKKKVIDKKTPTLKGIVGVEDNSNGVLNNTDSNIKNQNEEDVEKLAEDSYKAEQDLIDFLNNNPYDDLNSVDSEVTIDGITQKIKMFKDGTLNKKLADLREKVLDSRRNYNDAKMVILANSNDKDYLAQHGIYKNSKDASQGAVGNQFGPKISDDEFYYKQMSKDLENLNKKTGGNRSLSGSGSGASGSTGFNGGSGSSFETGALGQSSEKDLSVPTSYEGLGGMSAQFESGGRGSSAVGWDSTGGTSYGKYQIATKTGTMKRFMDFLQSANPQAYQALSQAGPADAGKTGKFAQVWQQIAKDGTLGTSEYDFIKKTHYDVGVSGIRNSNLKGMLGSSKALQEVMWSTSVQHGGGGASSIFNDVYKDGMSETDLIKAIYAKRSTKFGSSTAEVRASVINRFGREQKLALGIQSQPTGNGNASGGVMASNGTTGTSTGATGTATGKEPTLTNNSVTPKQPIGEDAMVNKTGTKDAPISVDNDTKTMVSQLKQPQQQSGGNNVAVINSGGSSNGGGNTVSNSSFGQKTPDPVLMYAALNK